MINEKSLQNLQPFKPGNKGGGRPKGSVSLVHLLKKALKQKIDITDPLTKQNAKKALNEVIVLKLIQQAIKGDVKAIKEVFDRTDGKSIQKNEHTGKDGNPIETKSAITVYIPDNGRD